MHILLEQLGLADTVGHICPHVAVPARIGSPLARGALVAIPAPLVPTPRGTQVVSERRHTVFERIAPQGVGKTIVHISQHTLHTRFVVEDHLEGNLGVGLFIKVVARRKGRRGNYHGQNIFI